MSGDLSLTGAIGLVRKTDMVPNKDVAQPVCLILRIVLLTFGMTSPVFADKITVFAAASLGDALADASDAWEESTGHSITLVLAGSSTLARQIEAGAPADVFVSANTDWMAWLTKNGRVAPGTLRDIASNRLVIVASDPGAQSDAVVSEATDIVADLGEDGRLAIALPDAVPAGIYARDALVSLGHWDKVARRLAPTDNVRAALALVALGEAPLGVVYATDALADDRVVVAGVFPAESHPPIRYPAAVLDEGARPDLALDFLDWLSAEGGQSTFANRGFLPPGDTH